MTFARLILVAFALVAATPAMAVPLAGETAQTCALTVLTSNPESLRAMQSYNICPVDELRRGLEQYSAVRVEPGMAADPLDIFDYAYYIDNRTTKALFVPAKTVEEWTSFIKHSPAAVDVTPACRPVTLNNEMTCGDEVKTNYDRINRSFTAQVGTGGRVLTFTCMPAAQSGTWAVTGSNGKPCTKTADAGTADVAAFDRTGEVQAVQQGWAIQRNFQ